MKDLKAIPEDTFSDDEEAILRVLRLIGQKEALSVLKELLKKAEKEDPITFIGPLEEPLRRLRDIVEKGEWKGGKDYEMLLWGLENFIEMEKDDKKTQN